MASFGHGVGMRRSCFGHALLMLWRFGNDLDRFGIVTVFVGLCFESSQRVKRKRLESTCIVDHRKGIAKTPDGRDRPRGVQGGGLGVG